MISDKFDFLIKMLDEPWIHSFSSSIEVTPDGEGVSLDINIPGLEKMKDTEEGLCVFLNIHGIEKENVNACV